MANAHESTFTQNIVEMVSNMLNRKYLHVAKHPVAIDSRVDSVIAPLRTRTNDVRVFGIHGMPGIGKTTIAKVVFNQLCNGFEGSCFLKNIGEKSQQPNGLVRLQEQLLHEVLKLNGWNIYNEDRGINFIKERLRHKRVLVVLDNVEQQEQLDVLVGEGNLFGPGSIIIITTRNEHLLNRFEAVVKYRAEILNQDDSLLLFSWHAFKKSHPIEDYIELSNEIVNYCRGLPLALEVLGSSLLKKAKPEWRGAVEKLQKVPYHQIQKKLRISIDTLDDDILKGTFLDIACFFVGRNKEYVAKILAGRGFFPEASIGHLINKSLLTINNDNETSMHSLLRDMGRDIVREMSPDHLGKRSRIWFHEDAWDLLNKQLGTKRVEGIALDVPASEAIPLSTESFTKMSCLRLLQINGVHLTGSFKLLSKELIWLCWLECPLTSLPSNFTLDNLVVLDMQHSNIRKLWKETKILNKLKILNLSYSKNLAKTPNLHSSSLEELILEGCSSLVEVHESVGHLKRLVLLNLKGCWRLKTLPKNMGDIESLTKLLVDGIENEQFLSSVGNLKYVRKLSLRGCNFNQDSTSLISSRLTPRSLNLKALLPTSLAGWRSLKELKIGYCATNCVDFGSLSSLRELDLSGNKFSNLPFGIGRLTKLKNLYVDNCKNLVSISDLPPSLMTLLAEDCTSMERIRLPFQSKTGLSLSGCENLMEIEGMEGVDNGWTIYLPQSYNLSNNCKKSIVEALCSGDDGYEISFSGGEIPEFFRHRGKGCSLSFHLPPVSFEGLVFWVVCSFHGPFMLHVAIKNKSNGMQLTGHVIGGRFVEPIMSWVSYLRLSKKAMKELCGEELHLYVESEREDIQVKECGVHVIVEKSDSVEESEWDHDNIGIDRQAGTGTGTGIDIAAAAIPSSTDHEQWKKFLQRELSQWQIYSAQIFLPDV